MSVPSYVKGRHSQKTFERNLYLFCLTGLRIKTQKPECHNWDCAISMKNHSEKEKFHKRSNPGRGSRAIRFYERTSGPQYPPPSYQSLGKCANFLNPENRQKPLSGFHPLRECHRTKVCGSESPYYCAPLFLMCVLKGGLAVCWLNRPKPKPKDFYQKIHSLLSKLFD